MKIRSLLPLSAIFAFLLPAGPLMAADSTAAGEWKMGDPIVTYWAGPGYPGGGELTDDAAIQLAGGGWNLVWCHENELDVAARHGLRGLLTSSLLSPASLESPERLAELDGLISRVSKHPAFYSYHLSDEPAASAFPALGKLVAHLRKRDPAHLAYINLLPTYASNAQLGTVGAVIPAYTEHLRKFVEEVRPGLLSYDHYQFTNTGDNPDYFLNLGLMREQALSSGLPFMNIVQASAWGPTPLASPQGPRVPNGEEMRFLVYSTLAYGAQGISYYVYCYPEHLGGIARPDGTVTPLYEALKVLNPEFVRIAKELKPLRSLGVLHAGSEFPGTVPLSADSPFSLDPPVPGIKPQPGDRPQGIILGQFGPPGNTGDTPTHLLVVNADYKQEKKFTLRSPAPLQIFDASTANWQSGTGKLETELTLPPGGGKLLRTR